MKKFRWSIAGIVEKIDRVSSEIIPRIARLVGQCHDGADMVPVQVAQLVGRGVSLDRAGEDRDRDGRRGEKNRLNRSLILGYRPRTVVTFEPMGAGVDGGRGSLTDRVRVVVVGGGIIGCGLLYYLARAGWTDSVLVEANELTSGTTWASSALITHFCASPFIGRLHRESIALYGDLCGKDEFGRRSP